MKIEKTAAPFLGVNSYDCWGPYITEDIALRAIEIFAKRLKSAGYEYFCFDANWYSYGSYDERRAGKAPADEIDEYGRWNPAKDKFPHGLGIIADACHAHGMKFGVHIFRGIPKVAVERNTKILGTPYRAQDICDRDNMCPWGAPCFGIDLSKPGAQEYYDSEIAYLAEECRVDFLKVDDIAEQPAEIEAVARAVEKAARPIVLSLSPGNNVFRGNWDLIRRNANMLRITGDIWDRVWDLETAFEHWELWENFGSEECWLDLDMIPFGELQSYIPEGTPLNHVPHDLNEKRQSRLPLEAKRTFMAQRALAASPLFFGGNLERTPDEDFELITNAEMLACQQNGVTGKRIYGQQFIDIRKAPRKNDPAHGWIGVFNRRRSDYRYHLPVSALGLPEGTDAASLKDIWTGRPLDVRDGLLYFDFKEAESLFFAY